MDSLDNLPTEILYLIAEDSEPAYHALITAYPRFAREVTAGRRVDIMVRFGHDVRVAKCLITWKRNGKLHRLNHPAMQLKNGGQKWYRDGKLHRDDGPAWMCPSGREKWYREGQLHRDDGPADIYPGELKRWYRDGKLHRDDGPAVIYDSGMKCWHRNGELCREGGPAIDCRDNAY